MTFGQELKKWRLERPKNNLQKQVCELFGVTLPTYQKWEQDVNDPLDLTKSQIRWIIAADKFGISVEKYIQNYQLIIKRVALEIESRNE